MISIPFIRQAFFHLIPENRVKKLSAKKKECIQNLLKMDAKKKLIQSDLINEGLYLSLKDLTNMKSKLKSVDENNLDSAVKYLRNEYNADVQIFTEGDILKALYFSTDRMKKSFKNFSEILFVDGTYKLLKLKLTVVILLVEDANGSSEVVGVGLLSSEDAENYQWLLETFSQQNSEGCKKLCCIMSDKDLKERGVFCKVFPDVPLHICRFHTMQIFKRTVNAKKLKEEERLSSLQILQQLIYSSSESHYMYLYKKLCATVPPCIQEYFNENWHNIRLQWADYGMINGNLGNLTNNRLESINQKFKEVIGKLNSLKNFINKFFRWYASHNCETDLKLSKCFTTKEITNNTSDNADAENEYKDVLTTYAYNQLKLSLERFHPMTFTQIDESKQICKIVNIHRSLTVTPTSCTCEFWNRLSLPCHHILAARKLFKLSLFDQTLCAARWTKNYAITNHEELTFTEENLTNKKTVIIKSQKKKKPVTVPEKRRQLLPYLNNIVDRISTMCGKEYSENFQIIRELHDALFSGNKILNIVTDDSVEQATVNSLEKSMNELAISEEQCLTSIHMPKSYIAKGRPARFLATTPHKKKREKKQRKKLVFS